MIRRPALLVPLCLMALTAPAFAALGPAAAPEHPALEPDRVTRLCRQVVDLPPGLTPAMQAQLEEVLRAAGLSVSSGAEAARAKLTHRGAVQPCR
ncbi:hypothetical protein [Mesobacterium pallidum]|uniref:hypothetical protein n=1 Tax=Mesobacterium pallidum TaxID=2872037 RepID=UPI001EE2A958|nr:hypothetical protein [Mesobacterium pallidum]